MRKTRINAAVAAVINPIAAATAHGAADATALSQEIDAAYKGVAARVRASAIVELKVSAPALVAYALALRAGVKGWAVTTASSMCASLVRMGEGCDGNEILRAACLKTLAEGKSFQKVNNENDVPTRGIGRPTAPKDGEKGGEKGNSVKVKLDGVTAAKGVFDALAPQQQLEFARHVFGIMVARIADPKVRVAAAEAFARVA